MRKIDLFQQKPARVTLMDVAREAGVSKPTACRALQGKGRISKETAERIMETAQRLGYQPDPTLSALSRYRWSSSQVPAKTTYSLAIINVLPRGVATGHEAIKPNSAAYHIRQRARELNLIVDEHVLDATTRPAQLSRMLTARGVDGIIFDINGPIFDWDFTWEKFACVTIGFDHDSHRTHAVTSDWFSALRLAVSKALATGYKRIGFANFHRRNPAIDARILGAILVEQARLAESFGPQPALFSYPVDLNPDKDVFKTDGPAFMEWYRREKPEIIIDTNSFGIWWLRDAGVKPATDVGYITLIAHSPAGEPQWSGTIHQKELQGKLAVDLLLNMVQINQKGLADTPLRLTTSCPWVDGVTIGKARAASKKATKRGRSQA
jgi:LacI family transcriptional regulator